MRWVFRQALLVAAIALVVPASAMAHARLTRAEPVAGTLQTPGPGTVRLTFSEPVAERFSIVRVTDAQGAEMTAGPVRRTGSGNGISVALRDGGPGWYLVVWRVISADGHPVRGAFTYAVGPNAGPAPLFSLPSLDETAATPTLVALRFAALMTTALAIGLVLIQAFFARQLRPLHAARACRIATFAAIATGLVAVAAYALATTARFALRPAWDVGAAIGRVGDSNFGVGLIALGGLILLLALASVLAGTTARETGPRTLAEVFAITGVTLCAVAAVAVYGLIGHAGQASDAQAVALVADAVHVLAGSVWLGGLATILLVAVRTPRERRVAALAAITPPVSRLAFASVVALVLTGTIGALIHLPALSTLWSTGYGQALLAKLLVLGLTLPLAASNLVRTRPRLESPIAPGDVRAGAARTLRQAVTAEMVAIAGIVAAAAILTSVAPPARALADTGRVDARVGPGTVDRTITAGPYRLRLAISPNRAAVENTIAIQVERDGRPLEGARVDASLTMLEMEMGRIAFRLDETEPGRYVRSEPALVMVGHWAITFEITPAGGTPCGVTVIDEASG